jgi:release factor glutamine methyltransferase
MTKTISPHAYAEATDRLRSAGCVFAEDEVAVLSAAADDEAALTGLVSRRAAGEPLEQVVGYADFGGLRIRLRPGVFVPRVRSELLVRLATDAARRASADRAAADRAAADRVAAHQATTGRAAEDRTTAEQGLDPVVVDLCCGSGALGAVVVHRVPGVRLHATDVAAAAVACARDNLAGTGAAVHRGDLFAALPAALHGHVDVLLANVPYVPTAHLPLLPAEARLHEPREALDGGGDGLDVFRAVVAGAPRWLAPGGVLLSECTGAQAAAAVAAIRAAGLRPEVVEDEEATAVLGHHDAPR